MQITHSTLGSDNFGKLLESERALNPAIGVGLALLGACLTGLCAQVRIQTPISPVPFTGQVLSVLLCGAILGGSYGGLSQAIYVTLGALGMPWYAGGAAGIAVLTGLTGGYLCGFVLAASWVGWATRHSREARTYAGLVLVMLVGLAIIHACGASVYLMVRRVPLAQVLWEATLPFVAFDLLKVLAAAALARSVLRS